MSMIVAKHVGHSRINLIYDSNGSVNITDAPIVHDGLGEFPSPVALLAEALAACALSTACAWCRKYGVDASFYWAEVQDVETDSASNSVASVSICFHFGPDIREEMRPRIEAATLRGCTVGNTLKAEKHFTYLYDA